MGDAEAERAQDMEESNEEVRKAMAIIYVKPASSGKRNGTSWDDAFDSLQEGIDAADPLVDQVWMANDPDEPSIIVGPGPEISHEEFEKFMNEYAGKSRAIVKGLKGRHRKGEAE